MAIDFDKFDKIVESTKFSHITNTVFLFAARYAHNRMTSAAMVVVNALMQNWDCIDEQTQKQIKDEAQTDVTCNHSDWERIFGDDFFEKDSRDEPVKMFKPEF